MVSHMLLLVRRRTQLALNLIQPMPCPPIWARNSHIQLFTCTTNHKLEEAVAQEIPLSLLLVHFWAGVVNRSLLTFPMYPRLVGAEFQVGGRTLGSP